MILYFNLRTVVCLLLICNILITELHAEPDSDSNATIQIDEAEWDGFSKCNPAFCLKACSARKSAEGFCDANSHLVCNCDKEKFSHAVLGNEGELRVTNASDVCWRYCEKLSGYGRVLLKDTPYGPATKHCICLTGQISSNGFTSCDRLDGEKCVNICHNPDASCVFNGACNCRSTWPGFFNLSEQYSRLETVEEKGECEAKCKTYNSDWVGRVYDTETDKPPSGANQFQKKFCLCGEEVFARNLEIATMLREQGFQVCTGIKCKQRCQTVAAFCEPENRRACYCNNQNVFIKKHLWTRMPSKEETMCQQACNLAGLDARVIEWNPFFSPTDQRFDPFYRKTQFQYLYDGKFCHCIKIEIRLNQFRPCTDELCEFFCGHNEATCDAKTRRACFCNTHKLMLKAGRVPEPSERTCDMTCRANRMTGRILDVNWKTAVADWGGTAMNKYCACVRPVSSAGLSHCEPENDQCPIMCQRQEAYCTAAKVCQCGDVRLANRKDIRKPTSKEWDECSEKCRSWIWPLSADMDNKAWIYETGFQNNATKANTIDNGNNTAEEEPTSFTFQESPGQVALEVEALYSWTAPRKYCLCAKSTSTFHLPGFRGLPAIEPVRVPTNKIPCINNHTCIVIKGGLDIIY